MEVNKVYHGDNIEILKSFPDNSIDSVVTDPPYGINFMNKKWDYDIPSVEVWKEVFRVLKPGGHMLVACGTRTQHRMAVNIEDAGFEIRDIIGWLYGSGFPKSFNVAKGIEGKLVHGSSNTKDYHKLTGREIDTKIGFAKNQFDQGARPNDYTERHKSKTDIQYTKEEAKKWDGWGTALKPAMELWTLARKPLDGTVVENVLKHGVGGINIDGCRIGEDERTYDITMTSGNFETTLGGKNVKSGKKNVVGRFPANVIHDGSEEVVKLFPDTESGKMTPEHNRHTDGSPNGIYGKFDENHPLGETYGDSGSAARFFYTAKASQTERNWGLEGFEEKSKDINLETKGRTYNSRCEVCGKKFIGSPETICTCEKPVTKNDVFKKKNHHPTVKPLELMRYLVRLITPKGGALSGSILRKWHHCSGM